MQFLDNLVYDSRIPADIKLRIFGKSKNLWFYSAKFISFHIFSGDVNFIGKIMNLFDSFFIEEIFLIRDRIKECFFLAVAMTGHIDQCRNSGSCSNKDLGKMDILENKGAKYSLDRYFTAYRCLPNQRTSSSFF
jgi:hypothetical protein